MVDTLGMLICAVVQPANTQDYDGAKDVLRKAKKRFPRLKVIYADSAYEKKHLPWWVLAACNFVLEIVKKTSHAVGFTVVAKRWIVERTFAWLCRNRRMSKDYERSLEVSSAMIHIAMTKLMLRRLTPL